MNDYWKRVYTQVSEFLQKLSPARKMAMVFTFAVILIGIAAMFFWAGDKSFQPLMTNLSPEDSANIIRVLRDKRIPFRVDSTGKNISIPPESLYELRLELATMGLPQSSVVGYEVFDKQSLGATSFVQKLNEKRAKEGELMRTIQTIRGVRRSRVHLAIPQKTAFVEDQKKATASVVLDLEPGTVLNEKQVYGIGNLVARAVEGLDPADVSIVDSQGKVLSKNPSDPIAAATANQLEFRQRFEQDLAKSVEDLLGRIVGEGRVVARVNADLDFSQVNETQTTYDADGSAVRSVVKDTTSMEGTRPGPVGLAGARSNLPGEPPAANGNQVRTDTKKNNEVTNYEIPQTIRKILKPGWSVSRLSVAVVVDGKPVKPAGRGPASVQPWPAEKLAEIEKLVASTIGFNPKRGDVLEVKNMEFAREDFDEAERLIAEKERQAYIKNLATWGVIGLLITLFFMLVVRPFIKWITENTIESVDSFLPQTIEELERLQKNATLPGLEETVPVIPEKIDPDKVEGEMIKEKIITLVDANPHKAALILRDWLHAERKKLPPGELAPAGKPEGPGKGKGASATA